MSDGRLGVITNGAIGRMGTNQHLARSIRAIRVQGGRCARRRDARAARRDLRRRYARPAVASLTVWRIQARVKTSRPVWSPGVRQATDFHEGWPEVPGGACDDNGFKARWERFARHLHGEGARWPRTLLGGAEGIRLAGRWRGRRGGGCPRRGMSR